MRRTGASVRIVKELYPGRDGVVRAVKVLLGRNLQADTRIRQIAEVEQNSM